MAGKTVAVPKTAIISVISVLVAALVSVGVFMMNTHLEGQKEKDARQDSAIETNQQTVIQLDKASGIIAKDLENHKENNSAHAK